MNPTPQSVAETGVPSNLLEELALKILHLRGEQTLLDLAGHIRLSFAVVEELFQRLRKERLCEVKGMTGLVHRIALTSEGKARALDLLTLNQYAGPAPVPLVGYAACVQAQSVTTVEVHFPDILRASEHLVLDGQMRACLGTAVTSGRSIFLYGPPGTGKTCIAEVLANIHRDPVWIPYSVEVGGQIISVYDPVVHGQIDEPIPYDCDRPWVLCRRPRIMVGGELTIEMLDLRLDPTTKSYDAPIQMKANNGVLIVDDFGRQLVRPEALLNRWIVPLDRRIDFLSLAGGKKFQIPFDSFVVFATNLDPASLGDEAFFRRIDNKIKVGYATPEQFHEISRRVCRQFQLEYDQEVLEYLIEVLTTEFDRPLRPCYPRDIVQHILWKARYEGLEAVFDRQTVAEACASCFDFDLDRMTTEADPESRSCSEYQRQPVRLRRPTLRDSSLV
jgi:predicted ATPase with chaperone activity